MTHHNKRPLGTTNHPQHDSAHLPGEGRETSLIYAGIGARITPNQVLADMTKIAQALADRGWHLSSGGAHGADTAFAQGAPAGQRTLYLPWKGYNDHVGPDCYVLSPAELSACLDIASQAHPNWNRCSQGVRKLHARNVAILLGPSLNRPVKAVVCWTEGGAWQGGTGMGLRIASTYNIRIINLATISATDALIDITNLTTS